MNVNTAVGPQYQLTFAYDAKGRRIQKTVVSNSVALYADNCLYDGWNLVAILNSPSSIIESFTWGSDLSGSAQGAGGVGGLLEETYYGTGTTNCFAAYDGNGNVAELVNAHDGTAVANYEYGPFGEVIRATGPMAKANPFRFSTKYQDDESDMLYYGYRYYKASTGTWVNRDPKTEIAFKHLTFPHLNANDLNPERLPYGFAADGPISAIDPLGPDVWVVRDASGWIRHRWAVGNNSDGTYWSSDFEPTSHNMILRASCQGVINFYTNSIFNPTNLGPDFVIENHVVADQSATDKVRDYAKMRSELPNQPWYDACGNDCIDWAEGLARYAIGVKIRERLDKIQNTKPKINPAP